MEYHSNFFIDPWTGQLDRASVTITARFPRKLIDKLDEMPGPSRSYKIRKVVFEYLQAQEAACVDLDVQQTDF